MNKVVIIGCGNVGMSSAYALIIGGAHIDELVLIDTKKEKAEGEALDLSHALNYQNRAMKIRAGDYQDCENANIVIICAGIAQKVGETRFDLIKNNFNVFKSIISNIKKTSFNGIYLIATNPVDTLSLATLKLSGFDKSKVIGTGTTLDTARLRFSIAEKTHISTSNIHCYVLGEHGDSEFVAWQNANIGLTPLLDIISKRTAQEIEEDVKNSAYEIIKKKGNTSYGIGVCILRIVNAILQNENRILTVSCFDEKNNIFYSLPAIINRNGVKKVLSVPLSQEEQEKLEFCIETLKESSKALK